MTMEKFLAIWAENLTSEYKTIEKYYLLFIEADTALGNGSLSQKDSNNISNGKRILRRIIQQRMSDIQELSLWLRENIEVSVDE